MKNEANRLSFIVIVVTAFAAIAVSVYCLSSGRLIIFQNLFYVPIVIACMRYMKKGFIFSVVLSLIYLSLGIFFVKDHIFILEASARAVIFFAVAGVVTFLAIKREQAQEAAQNKDVMYKTLADSLPGKVFLKDRSSVYMYCNENYSRDLKIKPEEVVGKTDCDFFPTLLAKKYREDDKRVMESGKTESIEEEYIVIGDYINESKRVIVNTVKVPVCDKNGNVTGLFGIFWDITERKQEEEVQARLYKLINATSDFIGLADANTTDVLYINSAGRRMIGVGEDEDIAKLKISDFHPEWTNKLFRDEIIPTAIRDGFWNGECAFLHRDGREIPVTMVLTVHKTPNGEVEQFSTISRDITERRKAEIERERVLKWQQNITILQQSLLAPDVFQKKLKAITDGIVQIFDADFCRIWLIRPGDKCEKGCMHANAAKEPYVCRYREKCLHLMASSGRYTHIDGKEHSRVPFGCYKIGLIASGKEHRFLTNDAMNSPHVHHHEWARQLGLVSFAGYRICPPKGEVMGVLALFAKHPISQAEDAALDSLSATTAFIVQRNALDKVVIQSEKLASLGRLVSDISHEVNNPLMIISSHAQLSLMSGAVSGELKEDLELIVKECKRAAGIMHRILKFAQPSKGETKETDICKSIEDVVSIIEKLFEMAKVEIKRSYPKMPVIMLIDNQLMQEVFMNFLNNAKEAMPEGGTITIAVSLEGDFIRIVFKDTGCGMPEDAKKRLFEPFFTTKEKGTGLGLSICYGIIKAYNGKLIFESQLNKGSTITVLLPL